MSGQEILCTECGITLRPFMKVCPRCGAEREAAIPLAPPDTATSLALTSRPADGGNDSSPAVLSEPVGLRSRVEGPSEDLRTSLPGADLYLSPPDTERRFPRFTSAQLTLLVIGILLLVLGSVIAWLLWRQQQRDERRDPSRLGLGLTPAGVSAPAVAGAAIPVATPTPTADQRLEEAVRGALMAYNPFGFSRYQMTVADGVVTLDGLADHRPERQGAENVVRLVAGVKSVVNRLRVPPDGEERPVSFNRQEALLLEEALRRQLESPETPPADSAASAPAPAAPEPRSEPRNDAQREAERLRRELLAARQRADELAQRQLAEEALRRQAEEYLRRQEAERRAEAERRLRQSAATVETPALRSGTVAWSGIVDGQEEVLLAGSSASLRHLNGPLPREVRASFSAPMPPAPVAVTLVSTIGRGSIEVVQRPTAENGFTTIVRLDDSRKGGEKRYEFTLRWSM